jgi:hypothetical protein
VYLPQDYMGNIPEGMSSSYSQPCKPEISLWMATHVPCIPGYSVQNVRPPKFCSDSLSPTDDYTLVNLESLLSSHTVIIMQKKSEGDETCCRSQQFPNTRHLKSQHALYQRDSKIRMTQPLIKSWRHNTPLPHGYKYMLLWRYSAGKGERFYRPYTNWCSDHSS